MGEGEEKERIQVRKGSFGEGEVSWRGRWPRRGEVFCGGG